MVIDTTPACPDLMNAAMAVANLVVMPVRVEAAALKVLDRQLDSFDLECEIVLVPNFVTPASLLVWADLQSMASDIDAAISPQLSYHQCLAVPSPVPIRYLPDPPPDVQAAREELLAIAGALSMRLRKSD